MKTSEDSVKRLCTPTSPHSLLLSEAAAPQMDLFRRRPHTDAALSKKSNEDSPRNQELEMRQILEVRNAGVWAVAGGVGYFTLELC